MNKLVRSVFGVIFSSISLLSFLGLVFYGKTWDASAVKWVCDVGIGSLTASVFCFKWEDVKTLPRDLHEFFFVDDDPEEVVQQYVDTSDGTVPYQSPWVLGTEERKELPPAKTRW